MPSPFLTAHAARQDRARQGRAGAARRARTRRPRRPRASRASISTRSCRAPRNPPPTSRLKDAQKKSTDRGQGNVFPAGGRVPERAGRGQSQGAARAARRRGDDPDHDPAGQGRVAPRARRALHQRRGTQPHARHSEAERHRDHAHQGARIAHDHPFLTETRMNIHHIVLAACGVAARARRRAPARRRSWRRARTTSVIKPPQPTDSGKKVEVIEFFWYGCPHCNALQPSLRTWLKQKPADVDFRRVPAVFDDSWVPLTRAYYTLDAMGAARQAALRRVHRHPRAEPRGLSATRRCCSTGWPSRASTGRSSWTPTIPSACRAAADALDRDDAQLRHPRHAALVTWTAST